MKVIITGSRGFIGSYLLKYLVTNNHEVLEYDRLINKEANECIPFIKNVDVVIHLAAQTSVFNTDIQQIKADNIDTFINIANECNKTGTKLIYASSSTANNITSMYGISKKFDEEFAKIYCPTATGLRFHNVYSDCPRPGTLLWCLLNNNSITKLYNNGENIRCYTWVEDVIDAILLAINSNEKILNIVNKEPITTKEFADKVSKYYNIKYKCVNDIRDKDNINQLIDNSIPIVDVHYHKVDEVFKLIKSRKTL